VAWIVEATQAARAVLGPTGIITHAPQAPYFGAIGSAGGNPFTGTSGGYSAVWAGLKGAANWFHVQFYDQVSGGGWWLGVGEGRGTGRR
jgi:chitinase